MKKYLFAFIVCFVLILSGCTSIEPFHEVTGVRVVEKKEESKVRMSNAYYVTVVNQKGEKARFELSYEKFSILEPDVVINIKYDSKLYIRNITYFNKE